jgi:hypothetical protein
MFGFHYFMWGAMALMLFIIGMLGSGAIDAYRMRAREEGSAEILMQLPIQALPLLTWDRT